MTIPGWRDWAFALKTCGAAMLALLLAMWIDLPRPYWAVSTVYITSQVLAGATRSKAFYRVLGTLLGACVTVILVPNLVNAPELLCLAIATWVGTCLYFSLLDRTPRSYLLMLAGYTAALIGFPSVADPEAIFDTAVSRAEEITLGILCASLVSSIVLPQSVAPVVAARLNLWLDDARGWVIDVLGRRRAAKDTQIKRLRLSADAIAFDALATPLRFDMTGAERSADAMATLRQHMLMFMPIVSGIADRIDALEQVNGLSVPIRALLSDLSLWLAAGRTDPADAARLRASVNAIDPALGQSVTWCDLITASLATRLRDFIDLRQDTRVLQNHIERGTPVTARLRFPYTSRVRTIRHRDHAMALLSAVGVFLTILVTSGVWIATGWPDGSGAPMMAAVACCFFAAQDDPAPAILGFANSAVVGALGAAVYLFAVLPVATNFEMLALALAPGLLACGLFMTQPKTAPLAMGAAVNGTTLIALQNGYAGDFPTFVNSTIAVVAGMWAAAVITRVVRSVGGEWSARRLRRINRRGLAQAAERHGGADVLELAAVMLDRVGLIAPRLATLPPDDAEGTAGLLAEVRVGINMVELRRARDHLPADVLTGIDTVLAALARHFRRPADADGTDVLPLIDAALDTAIASRHHAPCRATVMGLVGLRRGLFPTAPPYASRVSSAIAPEAAA